MDSDFRHSRVVLCLLTHPFKMIVLIDMIIDMMMMMIIIIIIIIANIKLLILSLLDLLLLLLLLLFILLFLCHVMLSCRVILLTSRGIKTALGFACLFVCLFLSWQIN